MQINAPFNPISARRARDLLGVTKVLSVVPQVTLTELGFIGDGNSHPLSERFGSLPAAQAVYPRAASLSEEIDGHAIQLCIDQQNATWKPVVVHLPPGCYGQLSFPIRSGKLPTLLVGENSTLTQRTAGANGWEHGTDASGFKALYGASFQVQGVKMCCLGKGGTAFFVQQDPTSGGFVMRDVNVVGSGDSSVNYWDRAVVGIGTSYTTFTNVAALGQLGGNLRDKLDAFYFTFDTAQFPTTQGAFIFRFVDCDISWFGRGYNFDIPRTMEGVWIVRGNVNSCRHAVRLFNSTVDNGGGVASPQFVFDGALMECWSTFFEFQSVKFITIVNCLFLINGPKPEYAADDYLWDWMKVGVNCTEIIVAHNHFEFFDKSHPRWLFNAEDLGIENVSIHHNTFRWNGSSAPSQIAQFGHAGYGRKGIREFSNVGLTGYVWSQVAGTANRENANFSEAAIISALMSTGDELVSLNFVTGVATIAGWRAATPQTVGAARIVYLDVPAGVLSKNPTLVTPCFADDAGVSAGETLAVSAGLTTKTRFAINVVGYNGSGARRLGFTAIG